jgi:hypothetical protein
MKHITERKTTMQVQVTSERMGNLVLIVTPEGIYYRERGRRTRFLLPHGFAYQQAVRLHVEKLKADRKRGRR